jgi:hypothetical protein
MSKLQVTCRAQNSRMRAQTLISGRVRETEGKICGEGAIVPLCSRIFGAGLCGRFWSAENYFKMRATRDGATVISVGGLSKGDYIFI